MSEFKRYRKIDTIEMRPYDPAEGLPPTVGAFGAAPELGDMIARDTEEPSFEWLIRRVDFLAGFDPTPLPLLEEDAG